MSDDAVDWVEELLADDGSPEIPDPDDMPAEIRAAIDERVERALEGLEALRGDR